VAIRGAFEGNERQVGSRLTGSAPCPVKLWKRRLRRRQTREASDLRRKNGDSSVPTHDDCWQSGGNPTAAANDFSPYAARNVLFVDVCFCPKLRQQGLKKGLGLIRGAVDGELHLLRGGRKVTGA
jgi:hypothetical protein